MTVTSNTGGKTPSVLVVEDDVELRNGLKGNLEFEHFRVITAKDGHEALRLAREEKPDLIVLDIMLPGKDGLEVCRSLRQGGSSMPILMLTAKSTELDKVVGLELGADDYMTKPFSLREFLARVKALLRRTGYGPPQLASAEFGNCKVDFEHFTLTKKKEQIPLSSTEAELLRLLVQHKGRTVTREFILDTIWGADSSPEPRTVDTYILRLRRKIEDSPDEPQHILTVHGLGYRFAG